MNWCVFALLLVTLCTVRSYRQSNDESDELTLRQKLYEKALEDEIRQVLSDEQQTEDDGDNDEIYAAYDEDNDEKSDDGDNENFVERNFLNEINDLENQIEGPQLKENEQTSEELDQLLAPQRDPVPWRRRWRIRIRVPRVRLPRIRLPRIRVPRIRIRLPRVRLPRIRLPRLRIRLPRLRRIRFRFRIPFIRKPKPPTPEQNPCPYSETHVVNTLLAITCDPAWKNFFEGPQKNLVDDPSFKAVCQQHTICASCESSQPWTRAQCDSSMNNNLNRICTEMSTEDGQTDPDTLNWCQDKVGKIMTYTRSKNYGAPPFYCKCGIEEVGKPQK